MTEQKRHSQIRRQIVLPWSKALVIAAKSIRTRFSRSLLTTAGVVLAIAFLVNVWTTSLALDGLREVKDDQMKLLLSARGEGADEDQIAGAGRKTLWLVSLSLLVCAVGVLNAMLMSVSERFREIGTMKCLGALDGFIIKLFLLESAFVGGIGSLIGVALGLGLTLVTKVLTYGLVVLSVMPWPSVLQVLVFAFFAGTILSVAAALYPAYQAARMQPVEAMRVDE